MSSTPLLQVLIAVPVFEVVIINFVELNIMSEWRGDELLRDVLWYNLFFCLVLDPNNAGIVLSLFGIAANDIACPWL